ncbi:hypothetical protein Y032_0857g2719 [Ancylostoma ceylanicum]|uniref:Endonuclease/exonuclease/phosphatase domain-containing protein n=1 Tax=Ancylostoma ceylanicum TaxID=53326 RepID=A0A016WAZ3_9BILA|nr:hypothetical protein Y032_0857g2719 [Ancylostoma ceylanicum]
MKISRHTHMVNDVKWFSEKAMASTGIDAHHRSPVGVKIMRVSLMLRQRRRWRATMQVFMDFNVAKTTRIATLNFSTLTDRSSELASALKRHRIDLCAVREARWSGSKSKDIGHGSKVVYKDSAKIRNGVDVIVLQRFRDSIAEVHRFGDRLTKEIVTTAEQCLHIFSAYTPHTGCCDQMKDGLWI